MGDSILSGNQLAVTLGRIESTLAVFDTVLSNKLTNAHANNNSRYKYTEAFLHGNSTFPLFSCTTSPLP